MSHQSKAAGGEGPAAQVFQVLRVNGASLNEAAEGVKSSAFSLKSEKAKAPENRADAGSSVSESLTERPHAEARRLLDAGMKLCELVPGTKQPVGDGWNVNPVTTVRDAAGGYGLILAANGLCSVDFDNVDAAVEGLARCTDLGMSAQEIRDAGVWTTSTRPGSGGRVTFRVPPGASLRWLSFSGKSTGTVLELRATSANLQDTLPGTTYMTKAGGPWRQDYAPSCLFTLDCAPELPAALLAWWERMAADVEFLREQQALLVGESAHLAVSSGGGGLAFASDYRQAFLKKYPSEADMVALLLEHGYTQGPNGRYAPATATGAACVRRIPGKDDLWQSDHQSDPLCGTFDIWTAYVVLKHGGDLAKAEAAFGPECATTADGFEDEDIDLRETSGASTPSDIPMPFADDRLACTDRGNVDLLLRLTGRNLRFLRGDPNGVLWWTGARWIGGGDDLAHKHLLSVSGVYATRAEQKAAEAKTLPDDARRAQQKVSDALRAWAKYCAGRNGIGAMRALAKADPRFLVDATALDTDPYLLGVQNGVVDLRTGALMPDPRDKYVTRRALVPYNPEATCHRWERFIDEITGAPVDEGPPGSFTPRPHLSEYLQRALGYSITGLVNQQCMFIAYGGGSNGKSLVFDTVRKLMGEMWQPAEPVLLTKSNFTKTSGGASPELAKLIHARAAMVSETDHGVTLSTSVVKRLTGDEAIYVRDLYEKASTVPVRFKLWMLSNAKPTIENLDSAIRGRIQMVPFDRRWNRPGEILRDSRLPDGDPTLPDTLLQEREGILAWLVRGAVAHLRVGRLHVPAEVREATAGYLNSQDSLSIWMQGLDRCEPSAGLPCGELHADFTRWLASNGRHDPRADSVQTFAFALTGRGVQKVSGRHAKYGLRLKNGLVF